jgi:hypothetical protein
VSVELSGLPIFDRDRNFQGYRGFGVCRQLAAPTKHPLAPPAPTESGEPPKAPEPKETERPLLTVVPAAKNVVPFRGAAAEKRPALTPVERSAFHEIAAALSEKFGAARVVQLHGKMKKEDQVASRKSFLDLKSPTQWIIGQVRSGIGIDLYTAQWEYFYSNDWSLENRLQAEDRGHRIGLKNKLLIFDAYARDCSVEDRLINTLRQHKDVHEMIMGDNPRNWI